MQHFTGDGDLARPRLTVAHHKITLNMEVYMDYQVGDIVKLKKPHPCGSQEWEILRVGMDFRLRCLGCDHQVMVPRKLVEKNTRGLRKKEA